MHVFITGLSGMIGFHLANSLLADGHQVTGVDNFNDYYDPELKLARANMLLDDHCVLVGIGDIQTFNYDAFWQLHGKPDVVMHLAAYANPRHSMDFPQLYIDTNITGTQRLIEACERNGIENVVYASSSCVMHGQPLPWNEHDLPGHQNNPYGWSKRANECQFKHSKIARTIGLRFFTVYGPWGRPDMALFLFTKGIIDGTPIVAFNNGNMIRDFTYVADIVNGVRIVLDKANSDTTQYGDIFNIGYGEQVNLMDLIHSLEDKIGKKAVIDYQPAHPADVPATWSDTTKLKALGYKPSTSINDGIENFVNWYRKYYAV